MPPSLNLLVQCILASRIKISKSSRAPTEKFSRFLDPISSWKRSAMTEELFWFIETETSTPFWVFLKFPVQKMSTKVKFCFWAWVKFWTETLNKIQINAQILNDSEISAEKFHHQRKGSMEHFEMFFIPNIFIPPVITIILPVRTIFSSLWCFFFRI